MTESSVESPRSDFQVRPTSAKSADVSPILLRQGDWVRLLFRPTLVDNANDSEACLRGTFCYQKKVISDEWQDVTTEALSSLRAGEGFKLELHSAEVLTLINSLTALYQTHASDGIGSGTRTYVPTSPGSVTARVAALAAHDGVGQVVGAFLEWADASVERLAEHLADAAVDTLLSFDAAIGVARLRAFIRAAEDNLDNRSEDYWQGLLARES